MIRICLIRNLGWGLSCEADSPDALHHGLWLFCLLIVFCFYLLLKITESWTQIIDLFSAREINDFGTIKSGPVSVPINLPFLGSRAIKRSNFYVYNLKHMTLKRANIFRKSNTIKIFDYTHCCHMNIFQIIEYVESLLQVINRRKDRCKDKIANFSVQKWFIKCNDTVSWNWLCFSVFLG